MIARHALFSSGSSISACEDLAHIGATFSAIEWHRASAVGLAVVAVLVLYLFSILS